MRAFRAVIAISLTSCALICALTFALPCAAQDAPSRIASTSLCGDSYLVAMVDAREISALSWQSNSLLSNAPEMLKTLPQIRDDAEIILAARPEFVLFGPGEGRASAPFLKAAGIKSVNLVWGEDFASIGVNYNLIRQALGLSAESAPDLPDINLQEPEMNAPRVLYLSRSGGTAGPGTLVDAAIRAAGGRNIITQTGWQPAQPELLITLRPDLIVTSYFNDGLESAQSKAVRNRALQALLSRSPAVDVPGKYWPCAGPGLYEATRLIEQAIRALPAQNEKTPS